MSPPISILADVATPNVFGTLGWAFLVSAVIWLLIWRLLRPGNSGSGETAEIRPPFVPAKIETIPESAAAEPSPKTAAAAGRVINISRPPKTEAPLPPPAEAVNAPPPEAPLSSEPEPRAENTNPSPIASPAETAIPPKDEAEPAPLSPVMETPAALESLPDNDLPAIQTATPEEAAALFKAELAAGIVRQDDRYGIVFLSPTDSPDDLKKIKGIAKMLEKKLNQIGVHQFRQIAVWTAPAVEEFSKLLPNFKDRIHRDDWIAQAKRFHEESYGEKL